MSAFADYKTVATFKEPAPFGRLLTIDLYGCKSGVCDDLSLCYDFLDQVVDILGCTKQAPPFIFRSPPEYTDKAGLSGWVPLIESGIQIHTLSPKNFISIDVYCCGKFRTDGVIEFAQSIFAPDDVEVNLIERGVRYHG